MKKVEALNLTVNGEVKGPIEIVIREGEAVRPVYPKKYVSYGVIVAPVAYAKMIKSKALAVVEYSYAEQKIKIFSDPTDEVGGEVTGKVQINPDLVAFGINKDKYFANSDLIKHIRKYAHCFSTPQEAKELIQSLQNFDIKFEQTHSKSDDRKGNSEESIKNAIKFNKGELKSSVVLSIPLFIGSKKVNFPVEVEVDRQGDTPVFGFYSIEMESIFIAQTEALIDEQLDILKKDFTCIQLS